MRVGVGNLILTAKLLLRDNFVTEFRKEPVTGRIAQP